MNLIWIYKIKVLHLCSYTDTSMYQIMTQGPVLAIMFHTPLLQVVLVFTEARHLWLFLSCILVTNYRIPRIFIITKLAAKRSLHAVLNGQCWVLKHLVQNLSTHLDVLIGINLIFISCDKHSVAPPYCHPVNLAALLSQALHPGLNTSSVSGFPYL